MRAWIRKRPKKAGGASYQCLYRRGGRSYRIEAAGTFGTVKDATARREAVQGWLASGRDPVAELARLQNPQERRLLRSVSPAYLASRVDLGASSRASIRYALAYWDSQLGGRPVDEITTAEIQAVIAASELSPVSLRAYLSTLRQLLDFAESDPNPARARLRLPKVEAEEINPPEAAEVEAILSRVSRRLRLPLATAEQCGLRVSELQNLEWGDVDEQGSRFRLRGQVTKRGKPRFVPCPPWMMQVIAATVPREDRTPTRRVFQGFNDSTARGAMRQACTTAGIAHYHPHDLRHRRISLWVREHPIADVAAWVGHAKKSMTLDTYTHVMLGGELEPARILAILGNKSAVPVMPR